MPHYKVLERLASSRHKAERRREHAELSCLVTEINSCNAYMNKNPESPLSIAQSLVDSAYLAALVGSVGFAQRNYSLAVRLLNSLERTAGEKDDRHYALIIDQVRQMRDYAEQKLEELKARKAQATGGRLERLVA
ncbi:hypothetical protein HYU16_00335 [Candidatus Woesearchaeota archaeon]|nr:hypothetical protein [Candidatus Woesearchaeota archaeon]